MGAPSKTRAKSMRNNQNAAKPKGSQRKLISISLSSETLTKVNAYAKANKISRGKAIDEIVMGVGAK